MFGFIKEGYVALSLFYYELALSQMGVDHADTPSNIIKARDLREQLNNIRGIAS